MTALLNGRPEMTLPNGDVLRTIGIPDNQRRDEANLSLECVKDGEVYWTTTVLGIGTDCTSQKNNSITGDFQSAYWSLNHSIAIAGQSKTVLISGVDGRIKFEDKPHIIDVGGIDLLKIVFSSTGNFISFVSTKRVVVVGGDFRKTCEVEMTGPLAVAESIGGETLRILEYDVADVKMPLREKMLDLRNCQCIESGSIFPTI